MKTRARTARERIGITITRPPPIGKRTSNIRPTACSKCGAAMPPGDGVAILLRRDGMPTWVPFCDACDPQRIPDDRASVPVTQCPPMAAHLLGESTPGWRREQERREERAMQARPNKADGYGPILSHQQARLRERPKP